jgi:hypothetical protein
MCDNQRNFVLPGWAHEHVVDTTGVGRLLGNKEVAFPGYYARTTGDVWKTCDKQALIRAESMTEQLAKVGTPSSTNGSLLRPSISTTINPASRPNGRQP